MSDYYYEACENCKGNYANCEACKKIYKQGVWDMWEATRQKCGYRIVTLCDIGGVCNIETCPIAQKLLKGVK